MLFQPSPFLSQIQLLFLLHLITWFLLYLFVTEEGLWLQADNCHKEYNARPVPCSRFSAHISQKVRLHLYRCELGHAQSLGEGWCLVGRERSRDVETPEDDLEFLIHKT